MSRGSGSFLQDTSEKKQYSSIDHMCARCKWMLWLVVLGNVENSTILLTWKGNCMTLSYHTQKEYVRKIKLKWFLTQWNHVNLEGPTSLSWWNIHALNQRVLLKPAPMNYSDISGLFTDYWKIAERNYCAYLPILIDFHVFQGKNPWWPILFQFRLKCFFWHFLQPLKYFYVLLCVSSIFFHNIFLW